MKMILKPLDKVMLELYNTSCGSVEAFDTKDYQHMYIYTDEEASYLIDAYELEQFKYTHYTNDVSWGIHMMGHFICGLDIRLYCRDFIEDKLNHEL